jgi:hypothetical protein
MKNNRLCKVAAEFQPFDYSFMLNIELQCLRQMLEFYESNKPMAKGSEECAKWIRIAIECLLYGYDKKYKESKVNLRNLDKWDVDKGFIDTINIALRNGSDMGIYYGMIRQHKAFVLYNKIRSYYMKQWWD